MSNNLQNKIIFQQVVALLQNARQEVLGAVNSTMRITYSEIGRIIVKEEQYGNDRAEYGKQLLKRLSQQLTKEFGKGFSVDNLQNMRKLYLVYSISEIVSSISENHLVLGLTKVTLNFVLKRSHYLFLINITDERERKFYEIRQLNTIGVFAN
ncbi:MAG: DUF1016 N-terminal domain-containing protein [Flavobacterium sp.]